jgi:hypothetical protein
MTIRGAARENDAASILDGLREAEKRLDGQRRWVDRFHFIARRPDWSATQRSRKTLHELQKEATDVMVTAAGEVGSEGVEQLRRYLRDMPPLHVRAFREGEDTVWKWLFWVSGVGAVLTGLLVFVRRLGD